MTEAFFKAIQRTRAPFPSPSERLFKVTERRREYLGAQDSAGLVSTVIVLGPDGPARAALMGTLRGLGPIYDIVSVNSLSTARTTLRDTDDSLIVIALMRADDEGYFEDLCEMEVASRLRSGARWIGYWPSRLPQGHELPAWHAHLVAPLSLGLLKRVLALN